MKRFLIEKNFPVNLTTLPDVKSGIHFETDGFFGKKGSIIF
jgi:hypothetical protein